jgi:hypothetical protein
METGFALGAHRARQVGDVVEVAFHGALHRADAEVLHDRLAQVCRERGSAFLLGDMAGMSTIEAGARRFMAEWNRTHVISGVALYGANFATRTIATLAIKAIEMMSSNRTEVAFVRDEAEARRWIAARRARLSPRARA